MKLDLHNTKDIEIVAKYLAGEMSSAELAHFEEEIESFPENKSVINEMKKDWERIGHYQEKKAVDANRAWEKLHNRLSADQLIPEQRIIKPNFAPVWVKWAAGIAMIMTIASISFFSLMRNGSELISLKTGTEANTLVQTLKDGSVIYLANNTTFTYPEQFSSRERKVSLEGEAFFDIYPNPSKPFLIETEKAIIEVLGTAFNVKSAKNDQFELTVERGKVRVTLKSDPSQSTIVLPGEKITTTGNQLHKAKTDNPLFAAWKKQRMQFKDESLINIINVINKNYNSKIQLQSNGLNERKLTVTFYNNSLETITKLICLSLNLSLEVKPDSTIIIKPVEK